MRLIRKIGKYWIKFRMLAQNMADKYGNPAGKITLNTRIIFPENVKF